MRIRHYQVLALLLAALAAVSVWLQFGLLAAPASTSAVAGHNQMDYYIDELTITGIGQDGQKYQLMAERLAHYPVDDRASLRRPRIVQYQPDGAARRIHADFGWLLNAGADASLAGNVTVTEGGSTTSSERMLIHLR